MKSSTDESNTIFVQVDPSTFRAVVQKLTGAGASNEPLAQTAIEKRPKRTGLKLHERRRTIKKLQLDLDTTETACPSCPVGGSESFGSETIMASPVSTLEFLALQSPTTAVSPCPDEERAIAEKGFYLHSIPLSTPKGTDPPELLPLFPIHFP